MDFLCGGAERLNHTPGDEHSPRSLATAEPIGPGARPLDRSVGGGSLCPWAAIKTATPAALLSSLSCWPWLPGARNAPGVEETLHPWSALLPCIEHVSNKWSSTHAATATLYHHLGNLTQHPSRHPFAPSPLTHNHTSSATRTPSPSSIHSQPYSRRDVHVPAACFIIHPHHPHPTTHHAAPCKHSGAAFISSNIQPSDPPPHPPCHCRPHSFHSSITSTSYPFIQATGPPPSTL